MMFSDFSTWGKARGYFRDLAARIIFNIPSEKESGKEIVARSANFFSRHHLLCVSALLPDCHSSPTLPFAKVVSAGRISHF